VDWIDRYVEALGEGVAAGPDERRVVLKLAREVAHRSERVNAPLAAYVVGQFVAIRRQRGGSDQDALQDAARVAEELLSPGGDGPAG
jgi:hypothetical protein